MDINKTKLHYNSWGLTSGLCLIPGSGWDVAIASTWVPQGGEEQREHLVFSAVATT